jgi:hypothetical protein
MDDVAPIIADHVACGVDLVTWHWADVARAAGALMLTGSPMLTSVACNLYRRVEEELSSPELMQQIARVCRSRGLDISKPQLARLIDACGLPRSLKRKSVHDQEQELEALEDRPVGRWCAISVRGALRASKLIHMWINSSMLTRGMRIDWEEHFDLESVPPVRTKGCQRGGTCIFLSDVRVYLRAYERLLDERGDHDVVKRIRKERLVVQESMEKFKIARRQFLREQMLRDLLGEISADLQKKCFYEILRTVEGQAFVQGSLELQELREHLETFMADLGSTEETPAAEALATWTSSCFYIERTRDLAELAKRIVSDNVRRKAEVRRRAELEEALKARGLIPRGDSAVSNVYILHGDGDGRRSLEEVVEVADEMNFYFTKTRYPQLLRRRPHNRHWNYSDGESDDEGDHYDPIEESAAAKRRALMGMHASILDAAPTNVRNLAVTLGLLGS